MEFENFIAFTSHCEVCQLFMRSYCKALRMIVAIISAGDGCELQDTIIRISDSFFVILRISFPPYHFFTGTIGQHFHCALQHYSPEEAVITEVHAGMIVVLIVCHTHRGSISGEINGVNTFPLAGLQHCFYSGETFRVDGTYKRGLLLVDDVSDCLFCISHHIIVFLWVIE